MEINSLLKYLENIPKEELIASWRKIKKEYPIRPFKNRFDIVYSANYRLGNSSETQEYVSFVTFDKSIAEAWVDKYNRIIKNHLERITLSYKQGYYPYMYDDVVYNDPEALVREERFLH